MIKPQKLHIFLWNDEENIAQTWKDVILSDGYERVDICSKKQLENVLEEFEKEFYDVVLLDVISEDEPLGLHIAMAIREVDRIVPIILITRFPEKVYAALDLEPYSLSGIFHESVMNKVMFRDVLLRPSLNQLHLSVPEFSLVRRCLWKLNYTFKEWEDKHFHLKRIYECLEQLPFSPSIESWHRQLTVELKKSLFKTGFERIGNIYSEIVETFQTAEPFHIANQSGRRHLGHNVQVFLMGLIIMLEDTNLRERAIENLISVTSEKKDPFKALFNAILLWGCISTTHDVAYLSQDLELIVDKIRKVTDEFIPALKGLGETALSLTECNWPRVDHGKVGAKMWETEPCEDGTEKKIVKIISEAIKAHNMTLINPIKLDGKHWAQFLLILCDELQDWHRERKEKAPGGDPQKNIPWRIFSLEIFRIKKAIDGKTKIEMQFVAKDFPSFVSGHVGVAGRDKVQQNFSKILDILSEKLYSEKEWEIELSADLISRDITPAVSTIKLPTNK